MVWIKRHKRIRQVGKSVCVFARTLIGVLAFKSTETALHTMGFVEWTIAAAVISAILIPVWGLVALTDE